MPQFDVDGLLFTFPDLWTVGKYDDWTFYRTRWLKTWANSKAVDIVTLDPDRKVWLIEVKDYSHTSVEPPSGLADAVARKVLDTLAALLPARVNAEDEGERRLATLSTEAKKLQVVLHMEQRPARSRVWPHAVKPADIRQKLKQCLKPVDRYALVSEIAQPHGVPWVVSRVLAV